MFSRFNQVQHSFDEEFLKFINPEIPKDKDIANNEDYVEINDSSEEFTDEQECDNSILPINDVNDLKVATSEEAENNDYIEVVNKYEENLPGKNYIEQVILLVDEESKERLIRMKVPDKCSRKDVVDLVCQ